MKKAGDEHTKWLQERQRRKDADAKYVQILRARGELPPQQPLPYFSDPQGYVLMQEVEPCMWDIVRIPVEGWSGMVVLCFMSPLDALIEGAYRAKPGLRYEVACAGGIGTKRFLAKDGSAVAALHLSWLAHEGRLLQTPGGMQCRYYRLLQEARGPDGREPEQFGVDADALDELEKMYEEAGLFAWQETNAQYFHIWGGTDKARHVSRNEQVEQAVRAARAKTRPEGKPTDWTLALFDSEFGQWHHVPIPHTVLDR